MSSATGSGGVAGERAAGAAEAVVECDCGGECGESAGEVDTEVLEGARAVAYEGEDVLKLVAATPPHATLVAPINPLPVIVTVVPTAGGPDDGAIAVIAGAGGL